MTMKTYIGTKIIKAEHQECHKAVHNSKIGDPGYKVEYPDGYISWCPKDVFEQSYKSFTEKCGWLIESKINSGHTVWLLLPDNWTTDSDKALRFARKEDAEGMIILMEQCLPDSDEKLIATEHTWYTCLPGNDSEAASQG